MNEEREKVAVSIGRAFKVAPVAVAVMARHRGSVPRVDLLERDLVPSLEAFVTAVTALRMFEATRAVTVRRHDSNLQELRNRTRFWLTYVRIDLPEYAPAVVEGSGDSADVIIDRARGLVDLVGKYASGEGPDFLAQMASEVLPLHERAVLDRAESFENGLERQTLQRDVRRTLVPVSEGVVRLRLLLRNALGGTHADVRALNIDAPSKRRKVEEKAANVTVASPAPDQSTHLAPTTGERRTIGQA